MIQITIIAVIFCIFSANAEQKDIAREFRIIGGKEAEPHSIPFQVLFFLTKKKTLILSKAKNFFFLDLG